MIVEEFNDAHTLFPSIMSQSNRGNELKPTAYDFAENVDLLFSTLIFCCCKSDKWKLSTFEKNAGIIITIC